MVGPRPWKDDSRSQGHICQDTEYYVREFEMCKSDLGSVTLKILWNSVVCRKECGEHPVGETGRELG